MRAQQEKIVVVGSLNMDIVVQSPRFPVSGETIFGQDVHFEPGGKGANQAVACARLGYDTVMLGAVGTDAFGGSLMQSLASSGVRTSSLLQRTDTATGIASITLTPEDNTILVVPGANGTVTAADVEAWRETISTASILLVQLEIPMDAVLTAVRIADEHGVPVVLNPAPANELPAELIQKVRYITPNQTELHSLTGIDASGDALEQAMDALIERGPEVVITTLGSSGVAWKQRGGSLQRAEAYRVEVVDTTGAGDSFNGAFACGIASGRSVEDSVKFAIAVSALAVTKFGAQGGMPTREDVEQFLSQVATQ